MTNGSVSRDLLSVTGSSNLNLREAVGVELGTGAVAWIYTMVTWLELEP